MKSSSVGICSAAPLGPVLEEGGIVAEQRPIVAASARQSILLRTALIRRDASS